MERSAQDHVLADADPPHAAAEELLERHAADGVARHLCPHGVAQAEFFPQRDANLVVLAEVLAEGGEARLVRHARGRERELAALALELRRADEVRPAVQARLARDARRDGDAVDGEVHLGVGRAEVDLLDAAAELGVWVDGKGEVVHEADRVLGVVRGREQGDGAREALRGGEDVRVEDPEEVVLGLAVRADEVVDLWVDADRLLSDEELAVDVRVLLLQLADDGDGGVGLVGDAEEELKVGVVLAEGRLEVLVQVAVEATQGAKDRDAWCRGGVERRRREVRGGEAGVAFAAARGKRGGAQSAFPLE